MDIEETALPGVLTLTPRRFGDDRGFFCEVWNAAQMRAAGIEAEFVQDNQSLSAKPGTLRGLHYQAPPSAQGKLVRCGRGRLFDVAVDFRDGSPTFGRWVGAELSAENGRQLWVPEGFLHGFVTREPDTEVLYKCTAPYDRDADGAVAWDDPEIGIDWGVTDPVLSDKDRAAPRLADAPRPFAYGAAP